MFSNKDYIYCVYKEKSFSKAADKLHISQPSLSSTVCRVERQLGMKIFDRKTKPISLTPFGVEYIRGIEQIIEVEKHLQTLSHEIHTLQSGNLSVGASNLSVTSLVPKAVAEFKRRYPNVHVDLIDTSTVRSSHMLDTGELDLVITKWPYDAGKYTRETCYEDELLLAVPREFPVNACLKEREIDPACFCVNHCDTSDDSCVSLTEVSDIPFILLRHTSALRQYVEILFKEAPMEPQIALETDSSAIAYNMAGLGLGATIISARLAADSQASERLCHYRIRSQHCRHNVYLCYSKGCYLTTAMQKFIEIFHELAGR